MSREKLLELLASLILKIKQESPVRVGIDGVDASGKTSLANALAPLLKKSGRGVIRVSVDDFHNPRHIRSRRGSCSPEGYYDDSFNYKLLTECLLKPLAPQGNRQYRRVVFDFKTDCEVQTEALQAGATDILIFDGIFLFRSELSEYWDLKIFLEVDFETTLARALQRDRYLFEEGEEILQRYQKRYIPGQQLYLEAVKPHLKADIVIDNNDFENPKIVFQRI